MRLLTFIVGSLLSLCTAIQVPQKANTILRAHHDPAKRALLQDVVTFDEQSLFIHGERVMIFSGEFHPWRLPVPSLWLDIFQKIKALGFNCVSFYPNWALLEGRPGNFSAEGVFDFAPFFAAASNAGVYLIARPGPYINAEVSFGGFPGWMQRVEGFLRTNNANYLKATNNYAANINRIIAEAQITNGGPVILYQPENEYTVGLPILFPEGDYIQYVEDQARIAGVLVPFISNDAAPLGHNAPNSGAGAVDIYGHDSYPLGFDCSNPSNWPALDLPIYFHATHEVESPSTPYSIGEFQGGSYDPWGGAGFNSCAALLNHEFERVFYKNNFAAGVRILNLYMTYGGTNWGNIGYPGGYSSYDYGAAIAEDGRTITREKYAELKLEANFLKVSPGYLTANVGEATVGIYSSNLAITVTRLEGNGTGDFYIVRHTDYSSTASTNYSLNLPISPGNITIPLINLTIPWLPNIVTTGVLTLNGRDSKLIVTNYNVSGKNILYSTAEIFTHQKYENKAVIVVYSGGPNEMNELVLVTSATPRTCEGPVVNITTSGNGQILSFVTVPGQRSVVQFDDVYIYIMDRNEAYTYWVSDVAGESTSLIIKGPYLVRMASINGSSLAIHADFNVSTTIEVIGAPSDIKSFIINNIECDFSYGIAGSIVTSVTVSQPDLDIPDLSSLDWYYLNSLPEIAANYDDGPWLNANLTSTNNSNSLSTPTSLYGSDYGFHAGILLLRGHFTADGGSGTFTISTQGGSAHASSIYLNGSLVGSWTGDAATSSRDQSYMLSGLTKGASYVLTVLIDNMGYDENYVIGLDTGKAPRGIIRYELSFGLFQSTSITWKISGNLGGEDYVDHVRGPLNEGGLYIERHGLHQPSPPISSFNFTSHSPSIGTICSGVAFYTAQLNLSLPSDKWDIPLAFEFGNDTSIDTFRAQFWVNGWNFGRYVSNIGPQTRFPVPEGILNYQGENWIGLAVWALEKDGARVPEFRLSAGVPVLTGRDAVEVVDSPAWTARAAAY